MRVYFSVFVFFGFEGKRRNKKENLLRGCKRRRATKKCPLEMLFLALRRQGPLRKAGRAERGTGREKTHESAACLASREGKRKREKTFFLPFCSALAPRPGLGLDKKVSSLEKEKKSATPAGPHRRRESTKNEREIGDRGTWVRPENGAADDLREKKKVRKTEEIKKSQKKNSPALRRRPRAWSLGPLPAPAGQPPTASAARTSVNCASAQTIEWTCAASSRVGSKMRT